MILSMTGFGKADVSSESKSYNITLKSVNSKTADFNIKLPSSYREHENEVRTLLNSKLIRGKVDLYIATDNGEKESVAMINDSLLKTYLAQLMQSSKGLNVSDDNMFLLASKMPNVITYEKEEEDENEWKIILSGIEEAIEKINSFRLKEGLILENDLKERVKKIQSLLEDIVPYENERIESVKKRLESQLEQIQDSEKINRDRFEQELIYYFEKLDVTEEKVRLTAHCDLFMETINEKESQGRKLGFISQEMGREINTIGSKANHAKIQQIVVEMKDELEKIKEQLFNIL